MLFASKTLKAVILLASGVGLLGADSFTETYSGSLTSTSAVLEETFSLASASNLVLTTTSYGGGSNLDGSSTSAGGFQPSLTLYTATGNYVGSQSVNNPGATADPATGLALDALLVDSTLSSGSYVITLTNWLEQQPPTATNLSYGFIIMVVPPLSMLREIRDLPIMR